MARGCACSWPRVFTDSPETCHRCGRDVPCRAVSPSTMRLATAISEYLLGQRNVGTAAGQHNRYG